MEDLLASLIQNRDVDLELCGKLVLYSVLKWPKKTTPDKESQLTQLLNEDTPLSLRLYTCKALIVRGDAKGYSALLSILEAKCQENTSQ